ncbi:DUF1156 domain-containing protein [Leptolyngbya sp. AN03gr2]|uniref:DUF1156 domain-containing protein n=1 Tax=unclassified Leptolyngbya TaxID=2650499 RepID=UPI003D31B363
MTTRKPVFIEKIMPVKLLNEQVYHEHGGNPFKGLHRWYSRKPLSFSRASVLGSLLPDGVSIEEFEYLLGLEWRRFRNKETKLYKTPPSPERIARVQELCEQQWGTKTPTVLDAFAGGGSIPFEAARYGLKVLASDLNPVAVVTMKAAIEYPLKFGPDLQQDIDKWVKWVGDEAEKRLAEFFPSLPNEKVQNYLWAHTVVCPNCESTVPLSPNWWLYKRPEKQNLNKWCAVRPIPNPEQKRVDFELVKGRKGKGNTIVGQASSLLPKQGEDHRQDACPTEDWEYDPEVEITISRAVGKCPNCDSVIENAVIMQAAKLGKLNQALYAVAYKQGKGTLCFRVPTEGDLAGVAKAEDVLNKKLSLHEASIPVEAIPEGKDLDEQIRIFCPTWKDMFNPRQLLTLVTYVEILNDVKAKLQIEYEPDKVEAIATYLALVLDRCVDMNCRLAHWDSSRAGSKTASAQHSLNLMWNYPEVAGIGLLWHSCADAFASDYVDLCNLINSKPSSDSLINISVEQASCLSSSSQQATGRMPVPQGLEFPELKKPELQITYRGDLPHWTLDGAIYFITFSTWEKQGLTPEAQKVVLDVCLFFNQQRYQIYALVVMPDHLRFAHFQGGSSDCGPKRV